MLRNQVRLQTTKGNGLIKTVYLGRQITVQSINKEHRVWITVEPTETGLSLAEKIKTIATFRTRKILSITTAAGRAVPLDNRPVFGSWMDMDSFQDGEQWKVEWGELDKSMVDKIFSKVLQVNKSNLRDPPSASFLISSNGIALSRSAEEDARNST